MGGWKILEKEAKMPICEWQRDKKEKAEGRQVSPEITTHPDKEKHLMTHQKEGEELFGKRSLE